MPNRSAQEAILPLILVKSSSYELNVYSALVKQLLYLALERPSKVLVRCLLLDQ